MNLLMTAPLLDSRGNTRYFIGAQIDVSGLVKDGTDLEAFQRMRAQQDGGEMQDEPKDEFRELSEMFNNSELDIVRKHGGNMHRELVEDQDDASIGQMRPRVLIQDQGAFDAEDGPKVNPKVDGKLSGPYKHVSCACLFEASQALTVALVSARPPCAFPPHPILLALAARSWHLTIPIPRPYRRQLACARIGRERTCRRLTRRNCQNPMAVTRDPEP
jgi:hypothetical protein